MKKYALFQSGREPVDLDGTLADCRAQLLVIARSELKLCRARYGTGSLHKCTPDNYIITVGTDLKSALWTGVSIINA